MFGLLRPNSPRQDPPMSPEDSPPPPMSMAGPPAEEFRTREELLEYVKDWAENQGYAVVIGRSRPNKLWIKCDRGGKYSDRHAEHPENRKRKRGESRLTECPFKVQANARKDGIWRCRTETEEHNHGPAEDLSVHPSLRRMTEEQTAKVNEMTESGHTPLEILAEMRRIWPRIKVLKRDIYNARKKYKTEKELEERRQGLHLPQPYQDPNGIMPGPTRTGRWAWLEEGDEIKRKKRKKPSLALSHDHNIAPELRDATTSQASLASPTHDRASVSGSHPGNAASLAQHSTSHPHQQQPQSSHRFPDPTPSSGFHLRNRNSSPRTRSSQPPSQAQLESLQQPPPHDPPQQPPNGEANTAKAPSSLVLMSRIERMDKELQDQKNMLAQILGAVKGVRETGG